MYDPDILPRRLTVSQTFRGEETRFGAMIAIKNYNSVAYLNIDKVYQQFIDSNNINNDVMDIIYNKLLYVEQNSHHIWRIEMSYYLQYNLMPKIAQLKTYKFVLENCNEYIVRKFIINIIEQLINKSYVMETLLIDPNCDHNEQNYDIRLYHNGMLFTPLHVKESFKINDDLNFLYTRWDLNPKAVINFN